MKIKIRTFKYSYFVLLILVATKLYSSIFVPDVVFDFLELILLMILFFVFYLNWNKEYELKMRFSPHIKGLVFFVFLSSVPAYLFHDQGFLISLIASRTVFLWMLYFLLHKWDLHEVKMEKIIINIGLIWSVIMIVQQITFPLVLFTFYPDASEDSLINNSDTRGGLIRIFVSGTPFAYFTIFYYWRKIFDDFSIKKLCLFLLIFAGLFFSGSRQIVFGVLLILFIDFMLTFNFKSKKSLQFSLLIVITGIVASPFLFNYISSLVQLSESQDVTDTDYIRALEMYFFLFEYWGHWLCYFFGNGWEHASLSEYGKEMTTYVVDRLHFYRSDVGLIGALNKFGLFYVLVIFSIYFKILIKPKGIIVPRYIKQFFIFLFLISFTGGDYFERTDSLLLLLIIFYIIDKKNEKNIDYNTDS